MARLSPTPTLLTDAAGALPPFQGVATRLPQLQGSPPPPQPDVLWLLTHSSQPSSSGITVTNYDNANSTKRTFSSASAYLGQTTMHTGQHGRL